MFMNKSRDDYHTYRHPLRVFSLIWYQPSKATHQPSQSKRLKTLSSHYALVSPRISRARMRSGLQDSEFLGSALSVTCQTKPILSTLLSDVWRGEYGSPETVLAIVVRFDHPTVSFPQFQETRKQITTNTGTVTGTTQKWRKRILIVSSAISLALEQKRLWSHVRHSCLRREQERASSPASNTMDGASEFHPASRAT